MARSERTRSQSLFIRDCPGSLTQLDRRGVRQDATSFQFYVISWRRRNSLLSLSRPDLIEVPSIKRATGTPVFPGGCLYFVPSRRKNGLSNLSSVESRSTSGHCKVSVMSLPFYILERRKASHFVQNIQRQSRKRLHRTRKIICLVYILSLYAFIIVSNLLIYK